MPRKSIRLTKGLVSKYKNTLEEAIPLDSEGEDRRSEEKTQTTEIDEELKSIDFNNTQTTIEEDEEVDATDGVPDPSELNEKGSSH
ncbi:hypothetical protein L6452_08655 [Arctium lappa]|uniref:Uncharacterized protein n=1 Tax=Arctium lappa TaxID=4217 RepID=A0ACB9DIZ9_ARCLA|nr:hypothetical protein L6452_08655 [Arctium lappa]